MQPVLTAKLENTETEAECVHRTDISA